MKNQVFCWKRHFTVKKVHFRAHFTSFQVKNGHFRCFFRCFFRSFIVFSNYFGPFPTVSIILVTFPKTTLHLSLLDNIGCTKTSSFIQENSETYEVRFGLDECGTLQSQDGNDLVFSNTMLAETEADDPFSPISFYTMTSIDITARVRFLEYCKFFFLFSRYFWARIKNPD